MHFWWSKLFSCDLSGLSSQHSGTRDAQVDIKGQIKSQVSALVAGMYMEQLGATRMVDGARVRLIIHQHQPATNPGTIGSKKQMNINEHNVSQTCIYGAIATQQCHSKLQDTMPFLMNHGNRGNFRCLTSCNSGLCKVQNSGPTVSQNMYRWHAASKALDGVAITWV